MLGTSRGLSLPGGQGQAIAVERLAIGHREGTGEQDLLGFALQGRMSCSRRGGQNFPVSRARFQHRNVSKLKREEQNRESDSQAAPSWLWTDRHPGEKPRSRHFYFGGRSGTSCLKPWGRDFLFERH